MVVLSSNGVVVVGIVTVTLTSTNSGSGVVLVRCVVVSAVGLARNALEPVEDVTVVAFGHPISSNAFSSLVEVLQSVNVNERVRENIFKL